MGNASRQLLMSLEFRMRMSNSGTPQLTPKDASSLTMAILVLPRPPQPQPNGSLTSMAVQVPVDTAHPSQAMPLSSAVMTERPTKFRLSPTPDENNDTRFSLVKIPIKICFTTNVSLSPC